MAIKPGPGESLIINEKTYQIAEHPQVPSMPYGQEGRRAVVYKLQTKNEKSHALKVFKSRFRVPGMVGVAEQLEPYSNIKGLQACERIVLTASRHRELLTKYPELTYAVLMPWVEGSTWQEILLTEEVFSPERSLLMARKFAEILVGLEEKRLAHCDLSGPNLIIQAGYQPALVDLEEMYCPDFLKPESLPAGSPGYAHRSAPKGIWNATSDRFAGAILIAEMLCWHDPAVRGIAWGESYFAPRDMQNENQRLSLLQHSLEAHFGERILDLFNQIWRSDSLRDCPTFAEWAVALPRQIKVEKKLEIERRSLERGGEEALTLVLQAQEFADAGDLRAALERYREAIKKAPSGLSGEIEKRIAALDDRVQTQQESAETRKKQEDKEEAKRPAHPCPVCGEEISEGYGVCPHCEGVRRNDNGGETAPVKIPVGWVFGGLGIILGVVLIFLGGAGRGLFSGLATAKATMTPGVGSTWTSPKDGITMVYILAGTFQMGSEDGGSDESPIHEVYLDGFWIDEHEVTLGQYQEFMAETGIPGNPCGAGESYPTACVDWYDARAYCEWAGKRLPTEAEWEKAARGGLEGKRYPWGDEDPVCDPRAENGAQYSECSSEALPGKTFKPNGYGLYDMAGNIIEWVADRYDKDYYQNSPEENPQGSSDGKYRVIRTGSWANYANSLRVANREKVSPDFTGKDIGFRCAVSFSQ